MSDRVMVLPIIGLPAIALLGLTTGPVVAAIMVGVIIVLMLASC